MKKDKLICFIGESGSGKSTLAELLVKNKGYNYIKSYTTRKPRFKGEKGHIFVDSVPTKTLNNKEKDIDKDNMIAYNYFDGNHYWMTKNQYKNKGISICIVEPSGIKELKKIENIELIIIYLKTDVKVRISRMLQREDLLLVQTCYHDIYSKIIKRVKNDELQFKLFPCDYIINGNNSIKEVLSDIESILYDV